MALQADENHETVEFRVIERHRFVEIVDSGAKIRAAHDADTLILHRFVFLSIIGQHGVVDALGSFLGVQLSVVAVLVLALEVVDAVSHVAGLLYLCHEATRSDGVYSACRDKEAVVLLHLVLCQGVGDGVVLHHLFVLFGCDLHFQTVV